MTGFLLKAGQNGQLCRCGGLQDSSYNWTGEAETRMKIRAHARSRLHGREVQNLDCSLTESVAMTFVTLFCIVFLYPQIVLERSIVEVANFEFLCTYVAEIATWLNGADLNQKPESHLLISKIDSFWSLPTSTVGYLFLLLFWILVMKLNLSA